MTTKLIITRGLPASGKTTAAKKWVSEGPRRARVNRDDIRIHQLGMRPSQGILDNDGENLVTEIQLTTVRKYLRWDVSVIVDDTNLRQKVAREWADIAVECGAEFEVWDFTDVSLDECIKRDRQRAAEISSGRSVGEDIIRKMHGRFLHKALEPVVASVKAVEETRHYTPDPNLPTAWIFDIDGTLAQMGQRSPYDWDKVGLDTPKDAVREALWAHRLAGDAIVVMSGRDSGCRDITEKWLADHEIEYDALYMREEGDVRKDTIVKAELFWEHVAPNWYVIGCYDDRNCVVEMWRSIGLTCMQVEYGDF